MRKYLLFLVPLLLVLPVIAQSQAQSQTQPNILVGTWTLTAADKLLPDGKQVPDYGTDPRGIAIFTPDGRYVVEIFRTARTKFVSGDRANGTAEEYKDAVLSTSCHFGRYTVDIAKSVISFQVDRASFPNWDDTTRVSSFQLNGDQLAWRTPRRPDGSIPVSIFKRVH